MGFLSGAIGSVVGGIGSFLGAKESADATRDVNADNARLSREMAQNSIRWKVEDAKEAGIHPLYALGAQTSPHAQMVAPQSPSALGSAMETFGKIGQQYGQREAHQKQSQIMDEQVKQSKLQTQAMTIANTMAYDQLNARPAPNLKVPDDVQKFHDVYNYLYDTGKFDSRIPLHQAIQDVVSGKMLPTQITEDILGDIGGEIHGGTNMIRALFK